MSRSYKNTPGWTDQSGSSYSRWMKKYANRRFRRHKGEVQNGKWHKRFVDSWTICDYKILYYSKQEVLREIDGQGWHQPLYRYYMK